MYTRHLIAVCAASLALASAASAETIRVTDTDSGREVRVSYADLDLSHAEGARILVDRVREASRLACGDAPVLRDLDRSRLYNACVVYAADKAIASVRSAMVDAIYQDTARPALMAER
jgi:UrcA family protein